MVLHMKAGTESCYIIVMSFENKQVEVRFKKLRKLYGIVNISGFGKLKSIHKILLKIVRNSVTTVSGKEEEIFAQV